jgi:hypothetical protein
MENENLNTPQNPPLRKGVVIGSAFHQMFTGVNDKEGNPIIEGCVIRDVLNTDKVGIVKYGIYYNCFDRKEVPDFGGHLGFYVDFNDEKVRKDLFYWAKNSIVVDY